MKFPANHVRQTLRHATAAPEATTSVDAYFLTSFARKSYQPTGAESARFLSYRTMIPGVFIEDISIRVLPGNRFITELNIFEMGATHSAWM